MILRQLLVLYLLGWSLSGCSDRQHRNPLDPLTTRPEGTVKSLEALAGNREVLLRWDFTHFDDIAGYRLFRRVEAGEFVERLREPLQPGVREFVDTEVENGTTYDYQLALLIDGEGEVRVEGFRRATPGQQVCWVGDRSGGLVWKISPDGRSDQFGRGRFPGLAGMAVNRRDGSCWASDQFFKGLIRISADGELVQYDADIGQAGLLSIDSEQGIGWVVDTERQQVKWFTLEATRDTLEMTVVDAHFVEPSGLAVWADHCWIVDSQAGRVLFYGRDGVRRVEFGDLEQPGLIAAGSADLAWVLVREGKGLMRLDATAETAEDLDLPFETALALDVDRQSGDCWVLGDVDLVAFSQSGARLLHRTEVPNGRGLGLDGVHREVWIATPGSLLKFTMALDFVSLLGGFSTPFLVEANPGGF